MRPYDIVKIAIKNKNLFGVVLQETSQPNFKCKKAQISHLQFTKNQILLADFIANYYCVYFGIAFGGFVARNSTFSNTKQSLSYAHINPKLPTLNKKQQNALEFIHQHEKTLLFGDTGSGKTEIYIHIILEYIKQGKNVLFLMPEISLTPQMEQRLKAIFGDLVCIWHSKITKKNKNTILSHLNDFKIIAGARSALFLPIENLGLIIVDEEHDDAYKSTTTSRFNAKDCAIYLSHKQSIKLVLGSATPSLNSYYHCKKNKEIFRLKGSYFETKKRIVFDSDFGILPVNLINQISRTLAKKKQIIIFVPIRGNFKILLCRHCGSGIKCKNCSINMSLHSKKNLLICHYCGFSAPFFAEKTLCKNCNQMQFQALKAGTQEIAKQLKANFATSHIEIFDRDEITTDSKLKKVLNSFNNGDIDILIGTQMISKGHNYHNVELVAILGIDYLLNSSDFRAFERAVSLLHQVSGRSGRKENGEVFIQTLNKDFFARFLGDYVDFLDFELNNRAGFYPPFVRLALIKSQNKDDKAAREILQKVQKIVESYPKIEIIGLNRAPLERINGYWRYFMLLRSSHIKDLLTALHQCKNEPISIDIDPLQII